jgi:hypothetical protein
MSVVVYDEKKRPLVDNKMGRQCQIISYDLSHKIIGWEVFEGSINSGTCSMKGRHMPFEEFTADTLEFLEIWDKLTEEQQARVNEAETEFDDSTAGRKKRRKEYVGLPREFPCSVCGKLIKIGPGALLDKSAALEISWQEYVANYKCQKCGGRKRKSKPEHEGLPREFPCSECKTKMIKMGPSALLQKSEEKGITWQEYVATYKCMKCNGGRMVVRRKADPKYDGIPRKLVCPCGFETKISPGKILKDAEKAGITWEEYTKAYRCRKCKKEDEK